MRWLLKKLIHFVVGCEYWKWLTITCWRHVNGRWYIFRDAPTWFVQSVANTELYGEDLEDARMVRYHSAACAELHTRGKRIENVVS